MTSQETYPDVTLPLTTPIPNSNHTSNSMDTVVILQRGQKGYFISRTRTFFVVVCCILTLAVCVLLTAFLTREMCTTEGRVGLQDKGNYEPHSLNSEPFQGSQSKNETDDTPLSSIIQDYPWSGIRLPRSLIPSHYDLELKIRMDTFAFSGSCNITVLANTSTRFVVFHRSDLALNDTQVSVRSMPGRQYWAVVKQYQLTDNQFHVLELERELPKGQKFLIQLNHFAGIIKNDLRGLYWSSYKAPDGKEKYLVSSQLQSTDARRVFPCFDEPDFKATFKITITHPTGYQAFSNMPIVQSTPVGNGYIRSEFDVTPKMSTYILAFVVADFKSRNHTFENGYSVKVWARPDAYAQTEHALSFAVATYKFFTDYFGIPDVVPKCDHVAVPDFSAGAMENWGLVIYRETALLYDPLVSSSSSKYRVTLIVAHEIAHTWFGNMATMRWWDDLWLNEGFASSLMYIAMDHVYPEWNVFAIQVVEDIFPVMVKDALITSHPVSTEVKLPEEIQQFFDMISYNKGMAVLRMLRAFIGPDNFQKGLQLYVRKYKFKNAQMDELWQTFTEAVNGTFVIGRIMDTWTRQMGYPMITVEDRGGHYDLQQSRFLLHDNGTHYNASETPYGYKWYIPFTYVTEDSPHSVSTKWLNMDSATIKKESNGWLLGNYEYTGFFRVKYEKSMWARLAHQLQKDHTVFPEASRAGLIGDAFAFSRANMLDYDITLNLTRYLKMEKSYVPWRAFLDSMEFLRGMLSKQPAYVHLESYLRKLVEPVFDTFFAQETLPERYLRREILSIACDVGLKKAVEYAKSMFRNWMEYNTRPPADLSLPVYSVGVREGGVEEWDFVWAKKENTTVASEREMMMEALAQTQKSFLLWRYIRWVFVPSKIKMQDVRVVMSYFTKTPLARMVSLDFLMSRWDEMNNRFGEDPFVMREVIQEVTTYVNTEYQLHQLERLFHEKPLKSASKATENALALIRANIDWRKVNYDKIEAWLQQHVSHDSPT